MPALISEVMSTPAEKMCATPADDRGLDGVVVLADDQRPAIADRDVHAAVGPLQDIDVDDLGQLADQHRLLVLQVQDAARRLAGPADRVVELRDLRGQLVHVLRRRRSPARRCRAARSEMRCAMSRNESASDSACSSTSCRATEDDGLLGERGEGIEEAIERAIDGLTGLAERHFDDRQRIGERGFTALRRQLLLQPALDQHVARGPDGDDIHTAAGRAIGLRAEPRPCR